jgi:hypothetical protein
MGPLHLSVLILVDLPSYWTWSPVDIALLVLQLCTDGIPVSGRLCHFFTVTVIRFLSVGLLMSGICNCAPVPEGSLCEGSQCFHNTSR